MEVRIPRYSRRKMVGFPNPWGFSYLKMDDFGGVKMEVFPSF